MKLNRRAILRAAGAITLPLPFLESLLPKAALAQAAQQHRFAVFVRAGNGIVQQGGGDTDRFWPRALGSLTTATFTAQNADRATSELGAYAAKLNLIRNVRLPFGTPACGHAEALPQVLTAARNTGGSSNNPRALGLSADWAIARALNSPGVGPLTYMAGPSSAYIIEGLSWTPEQTRTPAERSPLNSYMRMTGVASMMPNVQQAIASRRKSVNDLVRTEMQELMSSSALSSNDKQRLRTHFESVRDLEVKLTCDLAADRVTALNALGNPQANDVRPDVVRRFMDVIAWAFSCQINHAATIQVGEGNDQTQYVINGTRLPRFHWISHRIYSDGSDGEAIPNAVDLHHQVDRLQLQMFRYLLDRLSAYPGAAGGTLLDDSVAVWTNDLGSGPPHSIDNTPWILAGSAGGALKTGQFIDHGKRTNNQVLNTLLSAVGLRKTNGGLIDNFGDSGLTPGVIPALMA